MPRKAESGSKKAAKPENEINYAQQQFALGDKYYNGDGVPRDPVQARRWLEKAAAQGKPTAQYNLGMLYLHGHGCRRNRQKAGFWLDKAAAQGLVPDIFK